MCCVYGGLEPYNHYEPQQDTNNPNPSKILGNVVNRDSKSVPNLAVRCRTVFTWVYGRSQMDQIVTSQVKCIKHFVEMFFGRSLRSVNLGLLHSLLANRLRRL
jgi:hypothetical protein